MHKAERLYKSDRARDRRSKMKEIVNIKLSNLYSKLHKLRTKKKT
jgi:hypothetical protein